MLFYEIQKETIILFAFHYTIVPSKIKVNKQNFDSTSF